MNIFVVNVLYNSISEASKTLGISTYLIKKNGVLI